MSKNLTIAERLIVAADFKPIYPLDGLKARDSVRKQVLTLADDLHGTGVYFKINTALGACGYGLIDEIHSRGLRVFADPKLFDIKDTMEIYGLLLREAKPELLTVSCFAGIPAMQMLASQLPDTEILGVTILTDHKEDECNAMFSCSVEEAVLRFAHMGKASGLGGLISSAKEIKTLIANNFDVFMTLNTPAIRPLWALVPGDGQNPDRIMTPSKAFMAGVDRIVVGRPITQHKNPRQAVELILEEITETIILS